MSNVLKNIINSVKGNGCNNIKKGQPVSHVVYTNLIWLASYTTFILYTTLNLFLVDNIKNIISICLFFHLCYLAVFLLIKNGRVNLGKHLLLISTYTAVAIFDHLNGKDFFTYLYLFAFLPTALNIFHLKKQVVVISIYMALPLVYVFVAQFYSYAYIGSPILTLKNAIFFKVFVLSLGFILFVLFAAYMILRSTYKQNRLASQSIGLQTTLNNASGAIWTIDTAFNLIVTNQGYINSIENEFGIKNIGPGVNIKQIGLWDVFSQKIQRQYYDVLDGQEILQEITLNEKQFEVSGVPIYNNKEAIIGATFCSRDVTNKNNFEKVLIKAKKQAEEGSKAKERFLSNMSHEIRTPLNGIIGIIDILRDEKYLPEQEDSFNNLRNLSDHTLQLITNILDFAKIEAGKSFLENKRFGVKKFVDKINSIFISSTRLKGIDFKISCSSDMDIYVKGDETRLSQVLINLIGNAIKFTEKGSVQLIIDIQDNGHDNYNIQFKIIDTGIGIKKESLNKIFESFNQADADTTRKFGGTGLGLSISEKILNLMNSKLFVESEIHHGSQFYFSVCLEKSSVIPTVQEIEFVSNESVFSAKLNILLAEDNKINQLVATKILTKWQAAVTVVDDGEQAFEMFKVNNYDIILMDLDMPVMDGYKSLDLIRKMDRHIPIIALTAASFDDMENYLKRKGFNGVVQKPFVKKDLYNKILAVVKDRQSMATTPVY